MLLPSSLQPPTCAISLCSCKGKVPQSLAEFEKHAQSSFKKPADFTFVLGYELTLKEMILLVQVG